MVMQWVCNFDKLRDKSHLFIQQSLSNTNAIKLNMSIEHHLLILLCPPLTEVYRVITKYSRIRVNLSIFRYHPVACTLC